MMPDDEEKYNESRPLWACGLIVKVSRVMGFTAWLQVVCIFFFHKQYKPMETLSKQFVEETGQEKET